MIHVVSFMYDDPWFWLKCSGISWSFWRRWDEDTDVSLVWLMIWSMIDPFHQTFSDVCRCNIDTDWQLIMQSRDTKYSGRILYYVLCYNFYRVLLKKVIFIVKSRESNLLQWRFIPSFNFHQSCRCWSREQSQSDDNDGRRSPNSLVNCENSGRRLGSSFQHRVMMSKTIRGHFGGLSIR